MLVLTILLVRSGREGGGGGGSGCSVSVGVDDDGLLEDTRDTEEPAGRPLFVTHLCWTLDFSKHQKMLAH